MPISAEKMARYPGGSIRSAEWRPDVYTFCNRKAPLFAGLSVLIIEAISDAGALPADRFESL